MRPKALWILAIVAVGAGLGLAQEGGETTFFKVLKRRYDRDGDGRISAAEYGRDKARFKRFDRNGDGALTASDFGVADATPGRDGEAGGAPPADGGAAPADAKGAAPAGGETTAPISDADLKFFETKIRPVLATSCYECHGSTGRPRGGLRLHTREAVQQGGRTGPAVVAGDLDASLLIKAMRFDDEGLQMPPKGKLPAAVVADFEEWVKRGAPYPATIAKPADPRATELAPGAEDVGAAPTPTKDGEVDWAKAKSFWAFRDPVKQPPPMTADAQWAWSDIDRYLLAEMEAAGLKPVGDADKRTWLRRVTFDLVGLPPTPEEIAAFERDASPEAFEKVVDRLLASPAFGERFGRHWLDVARYAESSGKDANVVYPHAWRYRDYVIASYNADKPLDRFFTEQLAGDLLPAPDAKSKAETTIATGFLALGAKSHNTRGRPQFEADLVDEQIDAVSQAMLGLTVACARCHDHKFDPIPQRDYYAIAGVFRSTETCYGTKRIQQNNFPAPLIALPKDAGQPAGAEMSGTQRRVIEGLRTRAEQLAKGGGEGVENRVRTRAAGQQVQIIDDLFKRFDANGRPTDENLVAMGVRERRRPIDAKLLERGEVDQPKETIPRGFLTVLGDGDAARRFKQGSGRLELADAVASAENPLTARVYVNRLWTWIFGRGIVPTPDNFGASGTPPSHPALLDWLAVTFVEDGWSTKKMLKRICLSRAYRLASSSHAAKEKIDPENVRVWRMPKRRLEAEAIRDAMLAAAGVLRAEAPEGSPVNTIEGVLRGDEFLRLLALDAPVRSVYLPVLRGHVPHALEVFDFAEPEFVTGDREETNVASQALYLMNDPDVQKTALAFAERVLARQGGESERIAYAFELAVGRKPTSAEVSAVRGFLDAFARAQSPRGGAGDADGGEQPRRPRRPARNAPRVPERRPGAGGGAAANAPIDPTRAAWAAFCQSLFMSAEFRYVD